jgi:hypothetical protein
MSTNGSDPHEEITEPSMRAERAATKDLVALPPTLENIDAKVNFICTNIAYMISACDRAQESAETASERADHARSAAITAGTNALKAVQSREPLSRKERFFTVFSGSASGGAFAIATLWALGLLSISSCGAH